jgi:Ca2+-binding RTX toxin-like protein
MAAALAGRRRIQVWVVGIVVITAAMVLMGPLRARAADTDLESAAARLTDLADFLDNAADVDSLSDLLPLSDLAPKDALALADVFDDEGLDPAESLKEALASAFNDLVDEDDFEEKLDAVHVTGPGGVTIDIGGPTADDGADGNGDGTPVVRKAADGSVDIGLHIAITKQVDVPLQLSTDLVDLTDGTFPVTFTLATTDLHVHVDKELAADPATAADALWIELAPDSTLFAGGTAPKLIATASASSGALTPFSTSLGFTAVDVTGSFDIALGYELELLDPDASGGHPGDGKVSASELVSTAPADLLSGGMTDDPATDAIHAAIQIDSDLLPATPDVTIEYTDASLIDGTDGALTFDPPVPQIADFKNFTAQDALGAVMRLITMLNGIQGTGRLDVALPFITGKTNAVDAAAAANGTFSDVLRVSDQLTGALGTLALPSPDPANPNAIGAPTFADAQSLATALETAFGLSAGTIVPDYSPLTKRLEFSLDLSDSHTTQANLNFGDLDILSGIQMTTGGTVGLDASYDLPLTFALDLSTEPTEPAVGGEVGSCADGIDNDGNGDTDAGDAACAAARTLEQRVALEVGDGTTPQPELTARLGVVASGADAIARIGLLEAGIEGASLVVGSKAGEDGTGPASCADGAGDDMADPACRASITLDIVDPDDGWITVQDVLNVLGGSGPSGTSVTTRLDAGLDSTVPVTAQLAGAPLGGGDIRITGDIDADFTDPGTLLDPANGHIDIDASDLHLSDLAAFSPCFNSADDDGDGVVNDGCPGGPAAVDAPEESSLALFSKVVAALKGVSQQLDDLGLFPPGTLDQDLPLVGVSFNDLVSFADTLAAAADGTAQAPESAKGPGACTNALDDDGDGVVNDGCPTASGGSDPAPGLPEVDCLDLDVPAAGWDTEPDDDGDGVINDGCQPVTPSLQQLSAVLDSAITGLLVPFDPTPVVDVSLAYDPAAEDLSFQTHIEVDRVLGTQLTLGSLPGILGTIVSVEPLDAQLQLEAVLDLGFGLNVKTFTPYVLGSSGLDLSAQVVGENLAFSAGAGSLTIAVGQQTATPEAPGDCANTTDDDGDGFVNDGCAAVPNPETGDQCTGDNAGKDDDEDGIADDGCPGNTPAAVDDPEVDGDCTDADKRGKDNDGDGVADDGCNQANLPAQAGPGGDTESDGSPDGGPSCSITNTTDDDGDGVVNDGCPAKADKGRFFLGADLALDAGPASGDDDTKYRLDGTAPALTFTGSFDGTDQEGCDSLVIPAGPNTVGSPVAQGDDKYGCAILPLYFNDAPIGAAPDGHQVKVAVTSFSPLAVSFHYDTSELLDKISGQLIDLVLMNSGLDKLFDALESLLESELFSFALPIIGGQTATAAGIVDDLRATVKSAIQTAVSGGNPLGGGVVGADQVLTILENLKTSVANAIVGGGLTTSPGEVALLCGTDADRGCDTGFGEGDPDNPAIDGGGSAALCDDGVDDDGDGVIDDGCSGAPAAAESALNVSDVRLTFEIGGTVDLLDLPDLAFDIGIPGLGLEGDADPQGTITWSVEFGFGVGKNHGFYFFTGNDPEVAVGLDVKLSSDPANPAQITGTLGFLEVKIVDGDPVAACTESTGPDTPCRRAGDTQDPLSSLTADFEVDITDPGASDDQRLTFAELSTGPKFSDTVVFSLTAAADINLHIETGFPGGAGLPKLIADLHLDWSWGVASSSDPGALDPGANNPLTISLDNVGLDVGTYVTKFLKPLFGDIKRFTDPLKPVIDTVTACIPVLSDLSGDCVSLLTLAKLLNAGGINYEFIEQVIGIVKFIQGLPTDAPGNLTIPIGDGSFDLAGERLQSGALGIGESQAAFQPGQLSGLTSLMGALNGQPFVANAGGAQTEENGVVAPPVKAGTLDQIGVSFPFLENPEKLLGLLFGQDIDLVVWQPKELSLSFSYSQKFGPIWAVPPVFIEIGGSVGVTGRFGIGYTSKGFRNWLVNDQGPAALLQGLFLVDKHPLPGGPDSNELELKGELFANAQVSVLIFSAGAQGSIYMTIGIDLQDPNSDGRLEYDEAANIIRSTGNVLCIFNLNGKFGVKISVFAEVDLFFWSQRWSLTLADIVLYEFKVECKPLPDPVLARRDGNVLRLNVGPDAYKRDPEEYAAAPYIVEPGSTPSGFTNSPDGTPDNSVGNSPTVTIDENLKVTKVERDGGGYDVKVSGFGVTQVYEGPFTQVAGDAGDGNDVITLADGPSKTGGKMVFDIPADLRGGPGDDELTGSMANDTLVGGDGHDKLTGRDGVNTIYGDNVDDTGTGNDVIDSGSGNDFLYGGNGDDRISAGPGADKIVGGDGHDNIDGGRSTPTAADLGDQIWGDREDGTGSGNDQIDGNEGNDVIKSGGGKDRVDGGTGDDTIEAGGSGDPTCSGHLDDVLIGGPGTDNIKAGDGDDIVIGGSVLAGQPDVGDTLDGQNHCDTIFGDNATQGPNGPFDVTAIDPTIGGADTIYGGNHADKIHGQLGGDTIHGDDDVPAHDTDDGNDVIYGDAPGNAPGDDIVFADGGHDTVFGGPGDDDLVGGTGNDTIWGEAGQDFLLGDDGSVTRSGGREAHDAVFAGGAGNDSLYGGADRDRLYGQGGKDVVHGDGGADDAFGDTDEAAHAADDVGDTVRGGVGDDLISGGNGDDDLFGEAGNDRMIGGYVVDAPDDGVRADGFQDHMYGGSGADIMAGDDATITAAGVVTLIAEAVEGEGDLMFGEADADRMFGENGNDRMLGGLADDHMEGGDDDDTMYGESGNDDMIGGTTEAADGFSTGHQPDGGDTMYGGTGGDVMLGDNGIVTRPGGNEPNGTPTRLVTLYDLDDTSGDFSGPDVIDADESYDQAYGGGDTDTINGHSEDDHLQGNDGADTINGGDGQDDIIGGTSGEVDEDGFATVGGNHPDVGTDTLHGNDGHDVICGDNCSIRRTVTGAAQLLGDDLDPARGITGVVRRQVQLYDIATLTNPLTGTTTSDRDLLFGDDDHDVLYGQGGDDDLDGGAVDDYLEGGAGKDTIWGQGGQDDLVGGTGRTVSDDPTTAADGRLDDDDVLYGGDGSGGVGSGDDYDVIMGDNATVLRGASADFPNPPPGSAWELNTFNASVMRAVYLYDVATTSNAVDDDTNGADVMRGEADDDLMYGQGDDDDMDGGAGDDFMEGNAGSDTIVGGLGNDDMIGGTGHINDDPFYDDPDHGLRPIGADDRLDGAEDMSGEEGYDWMAGDNAVISRVLDDDGAWVPDPNGGIKRHRIWLHDVATVGGPTRSPSVSGGDIMHGNEDNDVLYGQGNGASGSDVMHGDAGDDYMEGNAGSDVMHGGADQDDMTGGTGVINDDPLTGVNGRLDMGDTMHGGTEADFQLGDNGAIVRPLDDDGLWTYFEEYNPTTIRRTAARFDVNGSPGTSGGDVMNGNEGDDYQWGQDGNDLMHGNEDNDDMYGELGNDEMYGDAGQDAMVGDRGGIRNTKLGPGNPLTFNTQGPGFFVYVGLVEGQLDRRVSLTHDIDGTALAHPGLTTGGNDRMRGGPGHDSMHGAWGDDLMNGDSGGDWLFGADGADVMWGGRGADPTSPEDTPTQAEIDAEPGVRLQDLRGEGDRFVDYLFGGHGGQPPSGNITQQVLQADILDYLPRAAVPSNGFVGDPDAWFEMTGVGNGVPEDEQYHQGVDWIYGGFDRDVMEADLGKNGPDFGDRLMDWTGAYNLFTRCNASYGDDGDIRQHGPTMQQLLQTMAYGSGAGYTAGEVTTPGTSAFRELGLVYPGDKGNSGKAFPSTPGNFQNISCVAAS